MELPKLKMEVAVEKCRKAHPKKDCVVLEEVNKKLKGLNAAGVKCNQFCYDRWIGNSYRCEVKRRNLTFKFSSTALKLKSKYLMLILEIV